MPRSIVYKLEKSIIAKNEDYVSEKRAIIRTLTYFDIFGYPLSCDEIRQFLDRKMPESVFLESLRILLEERQVFFFNGVYSIQDNPLLEHRRKQGNQRAERLLVKAIRVGRFLYQFPFVSAIGISGSLSKNYADENSDFDFFIITRPNRLWIARTLMHLYKKLSYLRGRQHHYCMNYYIDENALLLNDQNIFTAIEIKTLLPVAGEMSMRNFFDVNDWCDQYFPACKYRMQDTGDRKASLLKRAFEKLFGFDRLNDQLLHLTKERWKKKAERGLKNSKGIPMGLISAKHFAKADPGGFQDKILSLYEEKLRSFL